MKLSNNFIRTAFAAAILIPAGVMAAAPESKNQGYLVDSSAASSIVTSGTGLCWHTGSWTQDSAAAPCDLTNKPVVSVAPAPQPVVAVAPAPQPIVVAAAPLPQKVSFSGDAMFAFDTAVLKPEGKSMLDGLVRQLHGATFDTIQATGHTDRFGSHAYNQKLSERRAQAVKDYLSSKNVQASRVDAMGKGETEPVTKADACRGAKSTAVVACLQPDRRVDVELMGAKTVVGPL
jgi:OOP family OmpA-OmpF porin